MPPEFGNLHATACADFGE